MTSEEDQHEDRGTDAAATEQTPLLKAPDEQDWKPPRGFVWIELALFSNVFLYGFDSTITAATYAVISSEFDAANTASWLTTSYLVTTTAFQPLYGRFSGEIPLDTIPIDGRIATLSCGPSYPETPTNILPNCFQISSGGVYASSCQPLRLLWVAWDVV